MWDLARGFLEGHHLSPMYIRQCFTQDFMGVVHELKDTIFNLKWRGFDQFFLFLNQLMKIHYLASDVHTVAWECIYSGVPEIMEFVDNVLQYNDPEMFPPFWFWVIFKFAQDPSVQYSIGEFVAAVQNGAPPYYIGLYGGTAFRQVMKLFIVIPPPL